MSLIQKKQTRPVDKTWLGWGKGPKRVLGFGRLTKVLGNSRQEYKHNEMILLIQSLAND